MAKDDNYNNILKHLEFLGYVIKDSQVATHPVEINWLLLDFNSGVAFCTRWIRKEDVKNHDEEYSNYKNSLNQSAVIGQFFTRETEDFLNYSA